MDPGETPAPWWKCAVAALPNLLLGLQFLFVAITGRAFHAVTPEGLTRVMLVEFYVHHSMFFLGMFALYRPVGVARWIVRTVAFWGLFGLYVYWMLQQGWEQLALFLLATFVTYFGLFMSWDSPAARLQLAARFIVGFLLFMFVPRFFGAPGNLNEWPGLDAVVRGGAAYFLLLGAIELSGLYLRLIPRHARGFFDFLRNG